MDSTVYVLGSDEQMRQSMDILASAMGFTPRTDIAMNQFEELAQFDRPACVILNSGLRELEVSLEWATAVIDRHPMTRIILLGCECETRQVVQAMQLGISAVLEYPFSCTDLESAMQLALDENLAILNQEKNTLAPEFTKILTSQEQEIARMLLNGAGTKQISVKLDLSIRTIHYRKKAMFEKLGLKGRSATLESLLGTSTGQFCQ